MHRSAPVAALAACLLAPAVAHAYTIASSITDGCHESITQNALRAVRAEGLAAAIAPVTGDDAALIDDAPYDVDGDMADLGAVSLVLGDRNVDLHGNAPDDLDQLAPVHGDPKNQPQHCLRRPGDDEPNGSADAVQACQDLILARVKAALAGLDESGKVDPSRRTTMKISLDLRGAVDVSLPTFYLEMGRALHAVQDGFSHTWRSEDQQHITVVLNYSEVVNQSYDEAKDGPPHSAALDECSGLDAFRKKRLSLATDASAALLRAVLDPTLTTDAERLAAAQGVVDQYLSYQSGCTYDNDWCDARENEYRDNPGCGCTAPGAGSTRRSAGLVPLLLLAGLALLRRKRARRTLSAVGAFALLSLAALPARAAEPSDPPPEPNAVCPEAGIKPVDVTPDSKQGPEPFPFGVYAAGGISVTRAAFAVSLGGRYRLSPEWIVGLDGELNPWISRQKKEIRSGVTNAYATLVHRIPLSYERINLRSTLHLGISRINFALYGVPKGTIGPYVGFNLLGLDWEISRSLYFVIDPADVALPIPQTIGLPFVYPQYRFTVGIQLGA